MSGSITPAVPTPKLPQFSHYVRRDSEGGVDNTYPAMKYPPGYEDAHPEDWRAATSEEVVNFQLHCKTVRAAMTANPDGGTKLERLARGSVAAPTMLQLAEEDPMPVEDVKPAAIPPAPVTSSGAGIDLTLLGRISA